MAHITLDFVTDLPNSQGNTAILTVIDRFSKACRLISLPKLLSALETAELLFQYVFRLYGLPGDIISDCGPHFPYRVWSAFCNELSVKCYQLVLWMSPSIQRIQSRTRKIPMLLLPV